MFVDEKIRKIREQLLIINLSKEEIIFIENMIISKSIQLPLMGSENLLDFNMSRFDPVRIVPLFILVNSLMEQDINSVTENFFGGNIFVVDMLLSGFC